MLQYEIRENPISPIDPVWGSLIGSRWAGLIQELDDSIFLKRCRAGVVEESELKSFLVQQFHYSRHFTRYLCALLSNMANDQDRLALAENLFEELGLGEVGEIPHSLIYRNMMRDLGVSPESEAPNPATLDLVSSMMFHCKSHDVMDGLGAICLGAEAIVPHVYSQIVAGFRSRGVSDAQLSFFTIHIENDDDHALTMKSVIEREIQKRPDQAERLWYAAKDLIEKRRRFFDEISLQKKGSYHVVQL